ncbi:ultraviolet-B receptor UVR8 [Fopius arisanus]|uniref:Ultraviolet-B receptor UVR8 n=1 Tax=Fopius arisanus TaxID=64838 RepID=A0A9R1SWW2_9HYME|nr:PREDICTED: ultraviolet-B receptor UVR8 [Fopius arisanus]XP_011298819.1 PREDICTED: ultraviolet-B receptor UVR8 [Fopius arisanus]XP_011298820.1 PREDICTED: ultraviolet-B receptor UVR8 [Fopius arisanus]
MLFYAGLAASPRLFGYNEDIVISNGFLELPDDISGVEVQWNYFLVWKGTELFISGNFGVGDEIRQLALTEGNEEKFTLAFPDKESVTIVSSTHRIWQYKIYESQWRQVDNFLPTNDENLDEFITKIDKNSSVVALTNLGRIFNIPNLIDMPKRVKFVDVACGFDHSIILADNGDVYSMGMGTRGQLGHGDLEDCDEPTLIEALAGLNVIQIAAGGWHNAALTNDGDVYIWGWNSSGELGVASDQKVIAVPTVVDFTTDDGDMNEPMKKVQCGNNFTICLSNEGTLWGAGCNKYGQLGRSERSSENKNFIKLPTNFGSKRIVDVICNEWGSVLNVQ